MGTGTISHDLNRWWAGIRGKEDPFLKVGSVNDRSTKADSDYVWALRDINFEVKKGEVLGIIGKNGAGKSTLLKILSRVTGPTTGEIKTKGRIASLLEVGTGFHPELTGRENIYLNGAILGMSKAEIKAKEQEIIEFSGCERYVDTPVKRYSSGMRVRLAFAVAAHLEPDILVIDEVLAVGDAEFQKKAIGKMQDISRGDGRTVIFVSHNMAAVRNLCTRAILMENGKCTFEGEVEEAIEYYLENNAWKGVNPFYVNKKENYVSVSEVRLTSMGEENRLISGKPVRIEFFLKNKKTRPVDSIRIDFKIDDVYGKRIAWLSTALDSNLKLENLEETGSIYFDLSKFPLVQGEYILSYVLIVNNDKMENCQEYLKFEVVAGMFYNSPINITSKHTPVLLEFQVKSNFTN